MQEIGGTVPKKVQKNDSSYYQAFKVQEHGKQALTKFVTSCVLNNGNLSLCRDPDPPLTFEQQHAIDIAKLRKLQQE